MNKKALKIITALCMIVLIVSISSSVFAANGNTKTEKIESSTIGGHSVSIDKDNTFNNAGSAILGWIRGIGTFVAVGVIMVLGLKYMMGSASEKAEYKKTMIPYFIGAILFAAAINIAGFLFTASDKIKLSDASNKIDFNDPSVSVVEMV